MGYPVGLPQRIFGAASYCSAPHIPLPTLGPQLFHYWSLPRKHQLLQLNLPLHGSFRCGWYLQTRGFIFQLKFLFWFCVQDLVYPFIQFPPKVISCKTTIQYHSQDTDIDTIHWSYSEVPFYLHSRVWVCVFSSVQFFHKQRFKYPPPQSDTEPLHHTRVSCVPSSNHIHLAQASASLPILNPWQTLICSPFLQLCHFKNVSQMG